MEPITLATVTTAVVTLALDAVKQAAPPIVKETWAKVKGWLGWAASPPTEELAGKVAEALSANTQAAQQIVAELKKTDTGPASKLASQISITITNTTGDLHAGRDNLNFQGSRMKFGDGAKFGGS